MKRAERRQRTRRSIKRRKSIFARRRNWRRCGVAWRDMKDGQAPYCKCEYCDKGREASRKKRYAKGLDARGKFDFSS